MYAIKIRKSDLPFLTKINNNKSISENDVNSYLVINPLGANLIVTAKEFKAQYEERVVVTNAPVLLKLKK